MTPYYIIRARGAWLPLMAGLLMAACSDSEDGLEPQWSNEAIAFSASVVSSRVETRADASLVNLHETYLPTTRYDVGVFAAYTGDADWSETATANFMFNQHMSVGEKDATNHNPLSYVRTNTGDSPVRYWPNNGGKVSFWAYYPYNASGAPGEYGISITTDSENGIASGKGMGKIRFTMQSNTMNQNDFMMSDLVADRTKADYPLVANGSGGYTPKPVLFTFHHLLAQVRLYAFVRGTDRLVYKEGETYTAGDKYKNEYGTEVEAAGGEPKIDEDQSVRWDRTDGVWDVNQTRQRANITYTMSFNNIRTSATFTPTYKDGKTAFTYEDNGSLGSATVDTYVMNPYWFRFNKAGERVMLNDSYMYGYFEDTPAYGNGTTAGSGDDGSGYTWSSYSDGKSNAMGYKTDAMDGDGNYLTLDHLGSGKHYNYAPCNIILAVPQVLKDDDVPHVVITAKGYQVDKDGNRVQKDGKDVEITGKVTINLLNMNLKWESGFIYSYAFIDDEMKPGDDKVKGPESISVIFEEEKWTDQW